MNGLTFTEYQLDNLPDPYNGYPQKGYVYFVECCGKTKIGMTINPEIRIKGILKEHKVSADKIFLSDLHSDFKMNEKAIHKMYWKARGFGEWFLCVTDDIEKHYPSLSLNKCEEMANEATRFFEEKEEAEKLKKNEKLGLIKTKKKIKKINNLRDSFAMAALSGLAGAVDSEGQYTWSRPEDIADCAYGIADAMLAAREVKP